MKRLPKPLKTILPLAIITATVAIIAYFFVKHPQIRHALKTTNPWILVLLIALYAVFTICLAAVYQATLGLCGQQLKRQENLLLAAYSSVINFFGPLQSGPGVRAAYLKQRHNIRLRDYTVATLVYYGIYAVLSVLFLFLGSHYWWAAIPLAVIAAIFSYMVIQMVIKRNKRKVTTSSLTFTSQSLGLLSLATLSQLVVQIIIYYVELHALHVHASWWQAMSYSGAANLALFVSLTPGAIGFRESFLLFSQKLHHIGTNTILAASIIDRAAYVALLGILCLVVVGFHASKRFRPAAT